MSIAARVRAAIRKRGAVVTFPGTATAGQTYDPTTDTWSGGAPSEDATALAIQKKDDPERYAALGLTMAGSVNLLIAGGDAVPAVGMAFTWAGTTYTIKDVEPVAPAGTSYYFDVVGSR
jgi:hypothetical protein